MSIDFDEVYRLAKHPRFGDDSFYESLKPVGYWWSGDEPDLPHPKDFVLRTMERAECRRIISYLMTNRYASEIQAWMGAAWCRFGCRVDLGSYCYTDGIWRWPEGLAHYVMQHRVVPDKSEFLEHILSVPEVHVFGPSKFG